MKVDRVTGPSRRSVLRAGGAVAAAAAMASACDALSTDPEGSGDTRQRERGGGESPMLADLVESGELPPVEDRLPKTPMVIEPTERIGLYGGSARLPFGGAGDPLLYLTFGYDGLVRWDDEWLDVIPNVAEAVDTSDDARSYTFTLREGLKWSDGEPFTSEDVAFAYNDVLSNRELTPAMPSWLVAGGEPATIEAVDDYTIRFDFAEPNGMFLHRMATPSGSALTAFQFKHFSQFHPDHNADIDQLIADEGVADWVELFNNKGGTESGLVESVYWQNPDIPTVCAWQITAAVGAAQTVIAERNPYYFKTDTEGNQLPYLDELVFETIENEETVLLKATNGELDLDDFWNPFSLPNKPVFAQNAEAGGYRLIDVVPASMNQGIIALNLTHKDPQLREVFQNLDFRIGLSHAINRQEIIDAVYQRQGEPWQACPREESAYYLEELAKQYTEFDVDLANEHLDRAGYTERDNDGFRLRPDGQRIRFGVETSSSTPEVLELVSGYWAEVGVDMQVKTEARELLYDRKAGNEHDAIIWNGDGGLQDAIMDPRWYFPYSDESNYAIPWALWFQTGGEDGEEPPAATREQIDLYNQLIASGDPDERTDLFMQILEIAKEQFYAIGTVLPVGNYGIVPNDLHNVPEPVYRAWLNPNPASSRPEQFFKE